MFANRKIIDRRSLAFHAGNGFEILVHCVDVIAGHVLVHGPRHSMFNIHAGLTTPLKFPTFPSTHLTPPSKSDNEDECWTMSRCGPRIIRMNGCTNCSAFLPSSKRDRCAAMSAPWGACSAK